MSDDLKSAVDDCLIRYGAEFYGEIVGACMAVPGCTAVTTWGIDDSRTWLDSNPEFSILAPHQPLLFDASLEPKPAYFAVRDAMAAREGRSTAELVREAVAEYTSRRGPGRLPRSLGAGRSGRGDVSEEADRLLKGMGRR